MVKQLLFLSAFVSGLFLSHAAFSRSYESMIAPYQRIVDRYQPGWRIPTKKDWRGDWGDPMFVPKGKTPPIFVKGDFNGDGQKDFACICLIDSSESPTGVFGDLLLFEGRKNKGYRVVRLWKGQGFPKDLDDAPRNNFLKKNHPCRAGDLLVSRHHSQPLYEGQTPLHGWYEERIYIPDTVKGECLDTGTNEASGAIIFWNGKEYQWLGYSD